MSSERKALLLSLAAVGSAAAVAYFTPGRRHRRRTPERSVACVRARVVDRAPPGATVVDVTDERFARASVARTAAHRAVRTDAREEWTEATVDGPDAEEMVRTLYRDLPTYADPGTPEDAGIYVGCDGRVVLLSAVSWARAPAGRA